MSYRRTDDANFTGRFHDKLIGVFGDANVFRDIDSIPAGTRFEDATQRVGWRMSTPSWP